MTPPMQHAPTQRGSTPVLRMAMPATSQLAKLAKFVTAARLRVTHPVEPTVERADAGGGTRAVPSDEPAARSDEGQDGQREKPCGRPRVDAVSFGAEMRQLNRRHQSITRTSSLERRIMSTADTTVATTMTALTIVMNGGVSMKMPGRTMRASRR